MDCKPNARDPETALKSAVAIIKANEAMAKGVKLEISPYTARLLPYRFRLKLD